MDRARGPVTHVDEPEAGRPGALGISIEAGDRQQPVPEPARRPLRAQRCLGERPQRPRIGDGERAQIDAEDALAVDDVRLAADRVDREPSACRPACRTVTTRVTPSASTTASCTGPIRLRAPSRKTSPSPQALELVAERPRQPRRANDATRERVDRRHDHSERGFDDCEDAVTGPGDGATRRRLRARAGCARRPASSRPRTRSDAAG